MQTVRFQLSIADLLLGTALIAMIVATVVSKQLAYVLVGFALLFPLIWQRPVLIRLWICVAAGGGAGLAAGVLYFGIWGPKIVYPLKESADFLFGLGVGFFVGGIVTARLFIKRPPELPDAPA